MDGAAISANLGVNPSLIDHRAGRAGGVAVAQQGRGRPAAGAGAAYKRLAPIPPEHPVVPADAPAALRRLPIEPVSSAG